MTNLQSHGSFTDGFVTGYRTVRGPGVAMPALKSEPEPPYGWTPYLYGVRQGLKRAGVYVPA